MKEAVICILYFYNIISLIVLFSFLIGKFNLSLTKINKDTGEELEINGRIKYILMILISYGWFILPFVNEISKLGRRLREKNEKEN